ncbi:MAG TPA: ribonuclease HII [Gemmatimonadales bacterium]|nr:ribonuclease HII [Gemmatimonadales bacterium]
MPAPRPSPDRERAAWAAGCLLVGVDEVGRGPLAGPVVAAAVAFPAGAPLPDGLRDSKSLTARRRAALAGQIRESALAWALGAASTAEIDRINIRVATALAMRRALTRLLARPPIVAARVRVLVDGLPVPELGHPHDALVAGDAHCPSIAAASIVAKTVRDTLMIRLARRYPGYGWETNAGYGTSEHLQALRRQGPTRHHRRSFGGVG